jgi:hypothetical protein
VIEVDHDDFPKEKQAGLSGIALVFKDVASLIPCEIYFPFGIGMGCLRSSSTVARSDTVGK